MFIPNWGDRVRAWSELGELRSRAGPGVPLAQVGLGCCWRLPGCCRTWLILLAFFFSFFFILEIFFFTKELFVSNDEMIFLPVLNWQLLVIFNQSC